EGRVGGGLGGDRVGRVLERDVAADQPHVRPLPGLGPASSRSVYRLEDDERRHAEGVEDEHDQRGELNGFDEGHFVAYLIGPSGADMKSDALTEPGEE